MRTVYQGSSKTKILFVVLALFATTIGVTILKAKKGLEEVMVQNRPSEKILDLTIEDHFKHQTPINILLLGYAGGNHEGTYLTDSMIVVHLDLKQKKATLISLPRDVWVNLPLSGESGSYWKINVAYAIGRDDRNYPGKPEQFKGEAGGGALAKHAVEKITGLALDRFVAVDFKGFEKAIDLLGGIDVKIEKTFVDNEYPVSGLETDLCGRTPEELPQLLEIATISAVQAFPCRFETLRFDAGIKRLDGATALKFVRSRHAIEDGSDFARASRQRNLLAAVKEKVVSLDFVTKALPTLEILKNNFRTDFSLDDLKSFASHTNELNSFSINNLSLTIDNVLSYGRSADGQYILLPDTDQVDHWQPIHQWLSQKLNSGEKNLTPIIKVENGSRIPGLADLATHRLRSQSFIVTAPETTNLRNQKVTQITVFDPNLDENILGKIKNEFGTLEILTRIRQNETYDVLVTLGQDYKLKTDKQ